MSEHEDTHRKPPMRTDAKIALAISFALFIILLVLSFFIGKGSGKDSGMQTLEFTKPYTASASPAPTSEVTVEDDDPIGILVEEAWSKMTPDQEKKICALYKLSPDIVISAFIEGMNKSEAAEKYPDLKERAIQHFTEKLDNC